jgi:hypothetical protein
VSPTRKSHQKSQKTRGQEATRLKG